MTQRILLLLDNKENARLLRERLAARHAAICVTEIEQNLSHPLDLIIVDGPTLNRAGAAIQARKQAETPLFLPILLIVSRQDAGLQTRQLWQSVDELITLPVERTELEARIEILLRTRRQSMELQQRNDELAALAQALGRANDDLRQEMAARMEAERAGHVKDEFMAMISHELRTPLTGVLVLAEMLDNQIAGPINARQAAYVRGITTSGERLLHVVNGILGYTGLLSGKHQLQFESCHLVSLLDNCATSQQHKAAEREQTIAVQVEPPDLAITGDPAAIADVLKRLLDNAIKFTPEGGRVGLEAHPDTGLGTVELVVWDTGIGIAADQLDRIFKPFTQADARLSRSHEGIGLGLAYVNQMVRLMGGTVAVESVVGEGSRFTVTLPA